MAGTEGIPGKNELLGAESTGFTAHCPNCRRETVWVKARISHGWHLLLIVVTGGLWTVSWLALLIGKVMRPWRCEVCGWHKPEFRNKAPELED
jgi:predicted RNA-binding Zn-ribbon protein involved in translation (DUF1610 family)